MKTEGTWSFLEKCSKKKLFDRYHLAPFPTEEYLTYQYGDWKKIIKSTNQNDYYSKEFSGINIYANFLKEFKVY